MDYIIFLDELSVYSFVILHIVLI